jgi:nucleoside-diphosphate-sugar epimerase
MSNVPPTALVGHTGFVGGNLLEQAPFTRCYHSRNIDEIRGQHFGLVVCAGVSAVKWKANREPDADWAGIQRLQDALATVQADRFVLISTVDVYPEPRAVDESLDLEGLDNHAYGRHRLRLERFVLERYPGAAVVRLPALFGPGLKKNVLYDLMHDNCLEAIQPQSRFQWYDVRTLWADLRRVLEQRLGLVNLVTPPLETQTILDRFFPEKRVGEKAGPPVTYDVRTRHAAALGGGGGYVLPVDRVLAQLEAWLG